MSHESYQNKKPNERTLKLLPVSGIEFSAVKAKIRYKDRYDLMLALIRPEASVAGVFTKSLTSSAPVRWCQKILNKATIQKPIAILVNSGNANAFTGEKGEKSVRNILNCLALHLKTDTRNIFLASTGVIGELLDEKKIINKIPDLVKKLSCSSIKNSARAIMTTDTFPKGISKELTVSGQKIVITGIAKGSGMIAPDMATMLGFIFTNMSIASEVLQELTSEITERTFNAITIDSDTSTSDTVLVIASGKSSMPKIKTIGDPRALVFKEALEGVMQHLAHEIVHDGEGASKFVEYKINGAENDLAAKKIGFSIANSPLVKTALVGEDPNWGRIVMAIGKSGQKVDRDKLSIYFGETLVAEKGSQAKDYDEVTTKKYMKNTNLVIRVDLEIGDGSFTVWGCDLTNEYISINANYRS